MTGRATAAECDDAIRRVNGLLLLAHENGGPSERQKDDLIEAADELEELAPRAETDQLREEISELAVLARTKGDPGSTVEASIFERASKLLAEPDPGPTPFLVDELVADRAIACVLGAPKVGKTWMVCELAVCVAAGKPALSRFDVPHPGPVMVVLEESGRAALHRRLDRLSCGHNLKPNDLDGLHFAANRRVRLDEGRWRDGILAAANRLHPRAVVFDPLVRVKGPADENSQAEMAQVLDFFRELREEGGCAVVFAHHTGHQNPERMRGSSDLEGYWESKLTLAHDRKTGVRTLAAEHREAEATPTLDYLLEWHEPSETIALKPIERGPHSRDAELQDIVVTHVERHPGQTSEEIAKALQRRRRDVEKALEVVRGAGRLWKSSGGRDDSGRHYRRGGWYPSAHAASTAPLSRPDHGTTPDDSPKSSQSSHPFRGDDGTG